MLDKTAKVVCNVSFSTPAKVIKKAPMKEIKKKYGKISRKFNYCVNMFPDTPYYYIFEIEDTLNIIEFEASDEFLSIIKMFTNN
jgi:hypothetical protein